jgi:hypothetical protein
METPTSTQRGLGKRKRSSDEPDDAADGLFVSRTSDDAKFDASVLDNENADNGNNANEEKNANEENNAEENDDDEETELDDSTYHEGSEGFPACAAYDAEFEDIQQRLIRLSMEARVVLDSNDSNSEIVQNLRNLAGEVSVIPNPQPSMIGLLGEAGAGCIFLSCLKARI